MITIVTHADSNRRGVGRAFSCVCEFGVCVSIRLSLRADYLLGNRFELSTTDWRPDTRALTLKWKVKYFTPPRPMRQNCGVESRRAGWSESATVCGSLEQLMPPDESSTRFALSVVCERITKSNSHVSRISGIILELVKMHSCTNLHILSPGLIRWQVRNQEIWRWIR